MPPVTLVVGFSSLGLLVTCSANCFSSLYSMIVQMAGPIKGFLSPLGFKLHYLWLCDKICRPSQFYTEGCCPSPSVIGHAPVTLYLSIYGLLLAISYVSQLTTDYPCCLWNVCSSCILSLAGTDSSLLAVAPRASPLPRSGLSSPSLTTGRQHLFYF